MAGPETGTSKFLVLARPLKMSSLLVLVSEIKPIPSPGLIFLLLLPVL